ncbi:MAG: hypothetical protein KAH77_03045, partial [Thiomargarita sp.]|nr:hypothetical protein [Thiomargarita sp.]
TTAAKVTKTTKTVVAAKPKTSAVSQTRNISKITLADKLKKIAEGQPETTPEGEARKKSWDKQINNLYKKVETWLSEYSKGGYISFDTSSDSFELNLVGGHQVIFQPIEMNILGAMGRVDVYHRGYPPHKVMLLLHDKGSSKYHWELWKGLKKDEQVAFNKITLEGLLDQWIDS